MALSRYIHMPVWWFETTELQTMLSAIKDQRRFTRDPNGCADLNRMEADIERELEARMESMAELMEAGE